MQRMCDIKSYPDAFLLFRMGDFYELFYEMRQCCPDTMKSRLTVVQDKMLKILFHGLVFLTLCPQYIDCSRGRAKGFYSLTD
nr:hypothetical protein [Streptococcus infantis]